MGIIGNNALIGASGLIPYVADAINFDGSTDYLRRTSDLTGQADGKKGIVSCWVNILGGDGTTKTIYEGYSDYAYNLPTMGTDNKYVFGVQQGSGTIAFRVKSTTAFTSSSGWHHLLCSWDMNGPVSHLYIDDVNDEAGGTTESNTTLNYTHSALTVGSTSTAIQKWNGDMFDYYWNSSEYLDITQVANRRKFIDGNGKPVFLGDNGELPTGTSPILFLHLDEGETVNNFAVNAGTGGNFTVYGTPVTASSSPTD